MHQIQFITATREMPKFTRTVLVFTRFQPKGITKRPFVLVLLAWGLVSWVVGFAQGTYSK